MVVFSTITVLISKQFLNLKIKQEGILGICLISKIVLTFLSLLLLCTC